MKIQNTPNLQLNSQKPNNTPKTKQDLAFGGGEAFTWFLNFLDTNQTMGATVVDACCMGLPRTTVDFSRGPDAGFETMRREFASTINDALAGFYGAGVAWFLARQFNKQFGGIKAHSIFASDESLNLFAQIRAKHGDISSDKALSSYLEEIFNSAKAFNPEFAGSDTKGWINIDAKTQEKVIARLKKELQDYSGELSDDSKAYLKNLIADATGSEKTFKLEHAQLTSECSLDTLIDNVYKITKTFMSSKVSKTFESGNLSGNKFINRMKRLNRDTAAVGLLLSMAVGLTVQPLNCYLTKRKTGKTGFVGIQGKEDDKSNKFKIWKACIGIVGALAVMKSIGKIREIPAKVQFKGFIPTLNQFKLIYGATIISRVFAARDKNELRETTIKDSLGFASWLVFGGFVSKFVALGLDKVSKFKNDKFIRYNKLENGDGLFNKVIKSSIVSREEVLYSALKKLGISTIKENGLAMGIKEMIKELKIVAKGGSPEAIKALSKIRYLALIQFAGYIYSGLALGIGIPKLNIAITKHFQKKQKANSK